jgi:hypothetical protein
MWTNASATDGTFWTNIGLTWNIVERKGQRIVGHDGEDVGFSTTLCLIPERGAGMINLSNSDGFLLDAAADGILDILLS